MNSAQFVVKNSSKLYQIFSTRLIATTVTRFNNKNDVTEIFDPPENLELAILNYETRKNDPIDVKKARLLYQSRKRGMLENGLLLSTFAAKYLANMNEKQTDEYDKIINLPSNDWDIFYWAMNMKPTPKEFDNETMCLLKEYVKNINCETRLEQPAL